MNMKVKLGIILSVLISMSVLLSIGQNAVAAPGSSRLTDYYEDASFIEVVGTWFRSCNGFLSTEGTTSAYYVMERDGCDGTFCFITCTPSPCPQHILESYPCPEL